MKCAIGFLDGNICIRDAKGNYIIQDKEKYLPIIKEKIDNHINSINTFSDLSISNIILSIVKETFKINTVFRNKTTNSRVPHNDPLYLSLEKYIKENELYKIYLNEKNESRKITKEMIKIKKKQTLEHDIYCCELKKRKEYFKKKNGYKKI